MQTRPRALSRLALSVAAAAALAAGAQPALAQSGSSAGFIKPGEDTLSLNLGAIFNSFDTSVQFNGQTGNGTDINLENNSLPKTQTSLYASGTWRFTTNNRIDAQYWASKRSGTHTYDRTIDIDGTVIPIGATLAIDNKTQMFTADWRYSFVKNDNLEFAGMLGVYGGQFKYDINASGSDGNVTKAFNRTTSTTVPLPLIGASLDWYPDPRWRVSGDIAGLKARIGDVDGSVLLLSASTDYMLLRNLGVGMRYMYTDVSANVTKSSFNGDISFTTNSVSVYARLVY